VVVLIPSTEVENREKRRRNLKIIGLQAKAWQPVVAFTEECQKTSVFIADPSEFDFQ
jgi:hypothetical protein